MTRLACALLLAAIAAPCMRAQTAPAPLQASDFSYAGVVGIPASLGFTTQGLAYRPSTGTWFTIARNGFDPYELIELTLPPPSPTLASAGTATVVKDWGPLNQDHLLDVQGDLVSMRGLWWDDAGQRLWFSHGSFYANGADNPVLGYATFVNGSLQVHGPWKVSTASDTAKGRIFGAPASLRAITGQPLLMFGVKGSTSQGQSWGPGLVSVADPSALAVGAAAASERLIHWPMQYDAAGNLYYSGFKRVPGDLATKIIGNDNVSRTVTGSAGGGSADTIILAAGITDPLANGCYYVTDVDSGEQTRIVAWDAGTRVATVLPGWSHGIPTAGSRYSVYLASYEANSFVPANGRLISGEGLTSVAWIDLPDRQGLIYFGATQLGYDWYGNPHAHDDPTPNGVEYHNDLDSLIHPGTKVTSISSARGNHTEAMGMRWYLLDAGGALTVAGKVIAGTATAGDLQAQWSSAGDLDTLGGTVQQPAATPAAGDAVWNASTRTLALLEPIGNHTVVQFWSVGGTSGGTTGSTTTGAATATGSSGGGGTGTGSTTTSANGAQGGCGLGSGISAALLLLLASRSLRNRGRALRSAAALALAALGGSAWSQTWEVSSEPQLQAAVRGLAAGDTVQIADGTYTLTGTLFVNASDVAILGHAGDRTKVVLQGDAMSPTAAIQEIFQVHGANVRIQDLSMRRCRYHLIQVMGEQHGDGFVVRGCSFRDADEQMLKVTQNASAGLTADDGLVEDCDFAYTAGIGPQSYIGGIDAHGAKRWTVRGNSFTAIISPSGSPAEFAVHFWDGSANNVVERNRIVNCDRGVGFGLDNEPNQGGVIRNNMIYHAANAGAFADVGIALTNSPGTQVYGNTVYFDDAFTWTIEYRFAQTTGVYIADNLTNRPIISRAGGTGTVTANVTDAAAAWFVDRAHGDLHLLGQVSGVTDAGIAVAGFVDDYDGGSRPQGSGIDIGADELGASGTATTGGSATTGGGTATAGSSASGSSTAGSPITGGSSGSGGCGLGGGAAALLLALCRPLARLRRRRS